MKNSPVAVTSTGEFKHRSLLEACTMSALLGLTGNSLQAAVLEEVVVTAQKREESLQDVPISITAVTGSSLRSAGIAKMEDLAPSIPNFQFSEAVSGSDNMFMRGIGSGPNYGFEQAVGQVVDGFFFGRSRFGRATFLDVERVEVLKGPQGALIGKNTSGGAINITTAKPTQEFEAWISPTWEFEANEGYTVEGAVSGSLTENLRARLAARVDDRDGYVHNDITGDDQQEQDDMTARLTLVWDLAENAAATLMVQTGDFDRQGRTRQLSLCGAPLRNFDPDGPGPAPAGALFNSLVAQGEDCAANYHRNVVNTHHGRGNFEGFETDFDIYGVTLNWELEGVTVTSLTGYAEYQTLDEADIDATIAEIAGMEATEDYEQWSQELRMVSDTGGAMDYIAGVFVQHTEQTTHFRRDFAALPGIDTIGSNLIRTDQEGDTYALFGNVTWRFSERWGITLGGRYTREKKEADQVQFGTELYTVTPAVLNPVLLPGPGAPNPAAPAHRVSGDRTENAFSPTLNITWHATHDSMYYASARRGFKGGGFDHQFSAPQSGNLNSFEFEEEEVTAFEVGAKLTLADGAAQFNVALFRSEYDDLQVSALDSANTTFNVGNAASATTQGIEADLKWAATERLTLNIAGAWLDAEYDDYEDAPCNTHQVLAATCPNPAAGTQDLSGQSLQYAPDVSVTASAEYVWPLGAALELIGFVQMVYSDEFALSLDLDPNLYQDSYTKYDARLTLADTGGRWELSLIGRNLNDETTTNFGNDGLGGGFMAGTYFRMVDMPRAVAVQARLNF
ncbi:MAG: TonB-dependent receptor [Halioglobus sp.]|nr:TonB-dependent receptor [Halioglobus sp.]